MENNNDLKSKILELKPWHIKIQINETISTSIGASNEVSFIEPEEEFKVFISQLYPNGLSSIKFLDCACNCGAYCFWMEKMGAECLGVDVRDHWINQANFLKETLNSSSRFILSDIRDITLWPCNITMFKGIFYHLSNPIETLKKISGITKDYLILDTAYKQGYPDGCLRIAREKDVLMAGVDNLNWFPTGPEVLYEILEWCGFKEIGTQYIRNNENRNGRISILATKNKFNDVTRTILKDIRSY